MGSASCLGHVVWILAFVAKVNTQETCVPLDACNKYQAGETAETVTCISSTSFCFVNANCAGFGSRRLCQQFLTLSPIGLTQAPTGLTQAPTAAPESSAPSAVPSQRPTRNPIRVTLCAPDLGDADQCLQLQRAGQCEEPEVAQLCTRTCCRYPTAAPSHEPTSLPTISTPTAIPTKFPTFSSPTAMPTSTPTFHTLIAREYNLDLMFLLDESTSVTAHEWIEFKRFVLDVTRHVGTRGTSVGVASFSDADRNGATVQLPLESFDNFPGLDQNNFTSTVDTMIQRGGFTVPARGFRLVSDDFIPHARSVGAGVRRVLVLLSSGGSTPGFEIENREQADRVLYDGLTRIIIVTVNPNHEPNQLYEPITPITTSLYAATTNALDAADVARLVAPERCRVDTELLFVIDERLSDSNFLAAKDTIKAFLDGFHVGSECRGIFGSAICSQSEYIRSQVSVISTFGNVSRMHFALNSYFSRLEVDAAINAISKGLEGNSMSDFRGPASQFLQQEALGELSGNRWDIPRSLMLFTDSSENDTFGDIWGSSIWNNGVLDPRQDRVTIFDLQTNRVGESRRYDEYFNMSLIRDDFDTLWRTFRSDLQNTICYHCRPDSILNCPAEMARLNLNCTHVEIQRRCTETCFCPTLVPTASPTVTPTVSPSSSPTSGSPTTSPSFSPSRIPTKYPTTSPTATPTRSPTESQPTMSPTTSPTSSPTTSSPTLSPTVRQCRIPVDLVFLIDSSESMEANSPPFDRNRVMDNLREVMKRISKHFSLAGDHRIGAATFAATGQLAFDLNSPRDANEAIDAVQHNSSMEVVPLTNVSAGLSLVSSMGFRTTSNVSRVVIVMTDGEWTDVEAESISNITAEMRDAGIHTYAILTATPDRSVLANFLGNSYREKYWAVNRLNLAEDVAAAVCDPLYVFIQTPAQRIQIQTDYTIDESELIMSVHTVYSSSAGFVEVSVTDTAGTVVEDTTMRISVDVLVPVELSMVNSTTPLPAKGEIRLHIWFYPEVFTPRTYYYLHLSIGGVENSFPYVFVVDEAEPEQSCKSLVLVDNMIQSRREVASDSMESFLEQTLTAGATGRDTSLSDIMFESVFTRAMPLGFDLSAPSGSDRLRQASVDCASACIEDTDASSFRVTVSLTTDIFNPVVSCKISSEISNFSQLETLVPPSSPSANLSCVVKEDGRQDDICNLAIARQNTAGHRCHCAQDCILAGDCCSDYISECLMRLVFMPTTLSPTTILTTNTPSHEPSTTFPSHPPTVRPTVLETSNSPTLAPSSSVTHSPSVSPSLYPTFTLPTVLPSHAPSSVETDSPSTIPTRIPTPTPSNIPTILPTPLNPDSTPLLPPTVAPLQAPSELYAQITATGDSDSEGNVRLYKGEFKHALLPIHLSFNVAEEPILVDIIAVVRSIGGTRGYYDGLNTRMIQPLENLPSFVSSYNVTLRFLSSMTDGLYTVQIYFKPAGQMWNDRLSVRTTSVTLRVINEYIRTVVNGEFAEPGRITASGRLFTQDVCYRAATSVRFAGTVQCTDSSGANPLCNGGQFGVSATLIIGAPEEVSLYESLPATINGDVNQDVENARSCFTLGVRVFQSVVDMHLQYPSTNLMVRFAMGTYSSERRWIESRDKTGRIPITFLTAGAQSGNMTNMTPTSRSGSEEAHMTHRNHRIIVSIVILATSCLIAAGAAVRYRLKLRIKNTISDEDTLGE